MYLVGVSVNLIWMTPEGSCCERVHQFEMFAILEHVVRLVIKPIIFSPIARQLALTWQAVFTHIHCESKKTRHPTHVDNFAKNWSIFKILSLIDSEQTFIQNKYCIAHHTLQMLLPYLVKLQRFKNRTNSKIHWTLFWSICADVPA